MRSPARHHYHPRHDRSSSAGSGGGSCVAAQADRARRAAQVRAESGRSRPVSLGLFALAVVGALAGTYVFWLHVMADPLNDVQAYYWAGTRLNAGLPLYPPDQSVTTPLGYPYPPLLAILFRPLALLPFEAAAAIWEVVVIASFLVTVWWIGLRRLDTWLALGILALPAVLFFRDGEEKERLAGNVSEDELLRALERIL